MTDNQSIDSEQSSDGLPEEQHIKKFCKNMLKKSLFIGTFQERRLVAPLNAYRDIIKISDEESDFIKNLLAARKRCSKYFPRDKWIGITLPNSPGAPAGYNLWVTLSQQVFGSYWYKVKNVLFYENEITLKLEIVRPVAQDGPAFFSSSSTGNLSSDAEFPSISDISLKLKSSLKESILYLFSNVITVGNTKDSIIFISLLIVSIATLAVHAAKYCLDYSLKFMNESSRIITACTPIFQTFIGLIVNAINGLYRLIAFMWITSGSPKQPAAYSQLNPSIAYYDNQGQNPNYARSLEYASNSEASINYRPSYGFRDDYNARNRSSVKITPLD